MNRCCWGLSGGHCVRPAVPGSAFCPIHVGELNARTSAAKRFIELVDAKLRAGLAS